MSQAKIKDAFDMNTSKNRLQIVSLLFVMGLLLLTSIGNAGLMFLVSVGAIFALSIWFLVDRKIWLAFVSSASFVASVLLLARSLF